MQIENAPGLSNIALAAFSQQVRPTQNRLNTNTPAEQQSPLDQISSSFTDSVEISEEAQNRSASTPTSETQLSEEEQRQLRELQQRDREVRAHEQAHRARGGQFVRGGTRFEFQRGPNGQLFAVGGEVQIDTSEVPDDPQATIRKMRSIRAAALAPSNPSPTDRRVAAEATVKEAQARAELQNEGTEGIANEGSIRPSGISESPEQRSSTDRSGGPTPRGSILPFLNNQRVAATPGEFLNIFA